MFFGPDITLQTTEQQIKYRLLVRMTSATWPKAICARLQDRAPQDHLFCSSYSNAEPSTPGPGHF